MKLTSVVLISHGRRGNPEQPQIGYWCDVQGRFGGGYLGAWAGKDEDAAAAFAAREMIRYGIHRPGGAVLVAPPAIEVLARKAIATNAG